MGLVCVGASCRGTETSRIRPKPKISIHLIYGGVLERFPEFQAVSLDSFRAFSFRVKVIRKIGKMSRLTPFKPYDDSAHGIVNKN